MYPANILNLGLSGESEQHFSQFRTSFHSSVTIGNFIENVFYKVLDEGKRSFFPEYKDKESEHVYFSIDYSYYYPASKVFKDNIQIFYFDRFSNKPQCLFEEAESSEVVNHYFKTLKLERDNDLGEKFILQQTSLLEKLKKAYHFHDQNNLSIHEIKFKSTKTNEIKTREEWIQHLAYMGYHVPVLSFAKKIFEEHSLIPVDISEKSIDIDVF